MTSSQNIEKQWVLPSAEKQYSSILDELLFRRGFITTIERERFLEPRYDRDTHDPFLFNDMDRAVERIIDAVKVHERITIYGDYDIDGIGASVVLFEILTAFGAHVSVYMNHRERDGYGIQLKAIEKLQEEGTTLIITNDSGISNKLEIAYAHQCGIDTIITDHHQVPPIEDIPDAYAIIHPRVRAEKYPFKYLSGGGVAFKLVQALIRTNSNPWFSNLKKTRKDPDGKPIRWDAFEKWMLDAVCLSTIGDCVSLVGENRLFVKYGLIVLEKTRRIGLRLLLERTGIKKKRLSTNILSFSIIPRLNAASRMGHGTRAFQALVSKSQNEAEELISYLEEKNSERQKITERIFCEAEKQLRPLAEEDKKILIGIGETWSLGVLGLVAGKLCTQFQRPVVLATRANGHTHGTARSIDEIHITNAFQSVGHYFERFGGHAAAAGFLLKESVDFYEFKQALEERAITLMNKKFNASLKIDARISLADIHWELLDGLKKLEPYGEGNRKPLFLIEGLIIINCKLVGGGKHARLIVEQNSTQRNVIAFSRGKEASMFQRGACIDMVCELDSNEWNGSSELQISLYDFKLLDTVS